MNEWPDYQRREPSRCWIVAARSSEAGALSVLNCRRQNIRGGSLLGAELLPPDYQRGKPSQCWILHQHMSSHKFQRFMCDEMLLANRCFRISTYVVTNFSSFMYDRMFSANRFLYLNIFHHANLMILCVIGCFWQIVAFVYQHMSSHRVHHFMCDRMLSANRCFCISTFVITQTSSFYVWSYALGKSSFLYISLHVL